MALVVCVHGIAQQLETAPTLHASWATALVGGVGLAGGRLDPSDVRCAAYGDLFRPPGRKLAVGDLPLRPEDIDQFEQDLLHAWWTEAARVEPAVIAPDARTLAGTPRGVQAALRALSNSRFFAGLATRALLGDLRQVRDYLYVSAIRAAARQRVVDAIDDDTRVLVGHSLGSLVAYEALCAHPEWPVRAFVTLGSPLGIANLIFDALDPAPASRGTDPRGRWPGNTRSWSNIADRADVVAMVKDLRGLFGPDVAGWLIDNGAHAHAVQPYLTAVETGATIRAGLAE